MFLGPLLGSGPKFPRFLVRKASLNPVTLSNYIIPLLILQIENEKEKSHKQKVFVPAYIQEVSQFAWGDRGLYDSLKEVGYNDISPQI